MELRDLGCGQLNRVVAAAHRHAARGADSGQREVAPTRVHAGRGRPGFRREVIDLSG